MVKLGIFLILLPSTIYAMCVSGEYNQLVWNPAADALLMQKYSYGPEGGGSLAYIIIDVKKNKSSTFVVSSDFSPGDGSRPQRVSISECKANTEAANKILSVLNFKSRLKDGLLSCTLSRKELFKLSEDDVVSVPLPANKIEEVLTAVAFDKTKFDNSLEVHSNSKGVNIFISKNRKCGVNCIRTYKDTSGILLQNTNCEK